MNQKQAEVLRKVLAGAIGDDSQFWNEDADFDVDKFADDITKKVKQVFAPELKGRYMGEFTHKIATGLLAAGLATEDDAEMIATIKQSKADEIPYKIAELIKGKQTTNVSDNQKTVAEQVEAAKKAIEEQYKKQLNEIGAQLNTYKTKEYEYKQNGAIKSALPQTAQLNEAQFKALKSIILDSADISIDETGTPNLFHKGTETPFGMKTEKKTLVTLNEFVPQTLKDLGLWSEKPKPQTVSVTPAKEQTQQPQVSQFSKEARLQAAKEAIESK